MYFVMVTWNTSDECTCFSVKISSSVAVDRKSDKSQISQPGDLMGYNSLILLCLVMALLFFSFFSFYPICLAQALLHIGHQIQVSLDYFYPNDLTRLWVPCIWSYSPNTSFCWTIAILFTIVLFLFTSFTSYSLVFF